MGGGGGVGGAKVSSGARLQSISSKDSRSRDVDRMLTRIGTLEIIVVDVLHWPAIGFRTVTGFLNPVFCLPVGSWSLLLGFYRVFLGRRI